MQPTPARVRIALIDGDEHTSAIARALAAAGYEVSYLSEGQASDEAAAIIVHVTSAVPIPTSTCDPPQSGIPARPPSSALPSDDGSRAEDARQLAERQKMDAVARLAGGIAHDFNNLLAVISICADEVLDAIEPDEHVRACLDDIRHAVERGSAVTRDLLAFSQRDIQAPRVVDFNDIVTASHRMVERMVGDDVRIETQLAATEAFVRIDPSQWSSVFVNLALNARSAMPEGGSLSLRTREVTLDPKERSQGRPPGSYVELEVTDTGAGMPDEVRARIFEPFFTTKGASKSAGLGLSVVHGVVEQSGGWIDVTSEVGRGTTFRLYVPVVKDAAVTETRLRVLPAESQGAAVLVVEDEEAVRRIAVRALERSGYRVFQAGSAEEALAIVAETGAIDLLVTDIILPGMDGRRLAETLGSSMPDLAVLYTSGYTPDAVVRFGVARSELSFLQKPYSSKDLVERASAVLATTRCAPAG